MTITITVLDLCIVAGCGVILWSVGSILSVDPALGWLFGAGRALRLRAGLGPMLRATLWDGVRMHDGQPLPPRRLLCGCILKTGVPTRVFTRTDSRPGPGWMSDSYEGECCAACARIIKEKKVY